MKKICVYTICKNDSEFVERWFDSVHEADCITALVHDSKDDTAEKLISNGVKVAFTHYQHEPNSSKEDALNFAKQTAPDCEIFAFVPIDKMFEPGWSKSIQDKSGDLNLGEHVACVDKSLEETIDYYYENKNYDRAFQYAKYVLDHNPDDDQAKLDYEIYYRLATNKICVYTICRNESKFVDRWVENNRNADHIVALVHDCSDDTGEKLKALGVDVGYGFYKEWRFDNGKNDSMRLAYALAPECNIFVFTSLDEYWSDQDWAEKVKLNWIPGKTKQCWYNFVQSHDDLGHDTGTSYFNWMISRDPKWHWEYPIHEAVVYGDKEPITDCINLFEIVKLEHWPDKGKPRNYMELHKLRWEEYHDDISYLYLVREHILQGLPQEAYDLASKFDHEHTDLQPVENAYIWIMEGICCEYLTMADKAIECYKKAYALDNNLRTPLVRIGVIYAKCGAYHKAEEFIQKALDETTRTYSWLEDPWDWRAKPFYWLSYINSNLGNQEKALGYALFAKQIDPNDEMSEFYQTILDKYREGQ